MPGKRRQPPPGINLDGLRRFVSATKLPLDPEPATFEDVLAETGRLLNLTNVFDIPVPPWQYTLNTTPALL